MLSRESSLPTGENKSKQTACEKRRVGPGGGGERKRRKGKMVIGGRGTVSTLRGNEERFRKRKRGRRGKPCLLR